MYEEDTKDNFLSSSPSLPRILILLCENIFFFPFSFLFLLLWHFVSWSKGAASEWVWRLPVWTYRIRGFAHLFHTFYRIMEVSVLPQYIQCYVYKGT